MERHHLLFPPCSHCGGYEEAPRVKRGGASCPARLVCLPRTNQPRLAPGQLMAANKEGFLCREGVPPFSYSAPLAGGILCTCGSLGNVKLGLIWG